MAKELRIGIIGLMGYGSTYFRTIAGIEGARVTALCDAREDVLQRAAAQHNVSRTYTDYSWSMTARWTPCSSRRPTSSTTR